MIDLIDDVANLVNVPNTVLKKLVHKANLCIIDGLVENKFDNLSNMLEINIGIGTLQLISSDTISYRFIPSPELEKAIIKYLDTGENTLQDTLEKTLAARILKVYKDII